jgi:replicative DNA helicase
MDKPLPLDLDFYEKVIMYNALGDQVYLETILDYVNPLYFNNKSIQTVFKVLKSFYIENKKAPNIPELKAHLVTEEQKDALREVAVSFKTLDKEFDKNLLLKNTERFLREKSVLSTVIETSIDVNSGNIDSTKILKSFETACGISLTDNIGMDYLESIDVHCEELQRVFRTISTGWKWLDKNLGGGFMAEGRALYCFFGVTNVGKSIFLGNIATNILNQNKTVLLISLEMPEQVYAKRISAQLSSIPANDLNLRIDPLKKFLDQYKYKNSNSKLIIKEFPPKAVTILQIKSYINKLIRKGIKPDAIVIDYINLIAPPSNGLGSYESVKQICEGMRALSYDFECPIITATQANRAAYNKAAPDAGKTGESMGLSHTVDAQFSIWTEEGDSELGIIHLGIEKNRFGPREVYTQLNIDYPTLSLTEPESDGNDTVEMKRAPKMTADIENSDLDTNMSDTLDMLSRLSK